MSHRVFQQPDGQFAVWSTILDDFIIEDASRQQILEWYVGKQSFKAHQHMADRLDALEDGDIPYYGGIETYAEAVEWKQTLEEIDDE